MPTRRGILAVAALILGLAFAGGAIGATLAFSGHDRAAMPRAGMPHAQMMAGWHFRGRIISASRAHHAFWMRTTTHRSVHMYTNRNTHWDRCGWDDMHAGYRIDVRANRRHGYWLAMRM